MKWTVLIQIDSDDEAQVDAFAAYIADPNTDHKVEVDSYEVICGVVR